MRLKILFWVILLIIPIHPQQAGKIITSIEANSLFGDPDVSLSISSASLKFLVDNYDRLLINIVNKSIVIADKNRNIIHPVNLRVSDNELFHVYDSAVIKELLEKSDQESIFIEQRGSVLTLTNNGYTLEFGFLCPPNCT